MFNSVHVTFVALFARIRESSKNTEWWFCPIQSFIKHTNTNVVVFVFSTFYLEQLTCSTVEYAI